MSVMIFFFFKQKTAYEMRISDWSSDVCSSDLCADAGQELLQLAARRAPGFGKPDEGVAPLQHSLGEGERSRRRPLVAREDMQRPAEEAPDPPGAEARDVAAPVDPAQGAERQHGRHDRRAQESGKAHD